MAKIYTRTGDQGTTSLYGGARVSKDDIRVEAYGTIDELNAAIGLVRAAKPDADLDQALARIQHELFECGADLADPNAGAEGKQPWRIRPEHVKTLEQEIDQFSKEIPPLKRFVLPGGNEVAARLHFARTVARRAERRTVSAMQALPSSSVHVQYLNRLSDWLFVAARLANFRDRVAEILWEPNSGNS